MQKSPLFEFDPEIERTLHKLKRQRAQLTESTSEMAGGGEEQRRTLRDFVTPGIHSQTPGIAVPPVAAHNFELKPALISMVQQSQFGGSPMEDPNLHLSVFLEVCDTLKVNGASSDAIRLRLFPFSLRDKARAWLHSLPPGSISTWEELTKAFLARFFPPSKTASLRSQISTFAQRDDETMYEAWERFKDLLRLCPHHGLQKWMVVQTFYNGVTQPVRSMIDAAAGGTLMSKTEEEAYNLIEEMALNNFQWSSERTQPKRVGGKFELDAITLLTAKMDAMTQKLSLIHI